MGSPDPMRDPDREPVEPHTPPPEPMPGRAAERPGARGEEPEVRGPFRTEPRQTKTSGKAIASLILALLGLFIFPIILSLVAVILGWSALKDIERTPNTKGRGLAIAGLVIGVVGIVTGLIGVFVAAAYNWTAGFFN